MGLLKSLKVSLYSQYIKIKEILNFNLSTHKFSEVMYLFFDCQNSSCSKLSKLFITLSFFFIYLFAPKKILII